VRGCGHGASPGPPGRPPQNNPRFVVTNPTGVGNRGRSLPSAARAARELPCRGRGASHDGDDLVEGQVEHIVQHERDPLGGRQGVQHHQHRHADALGKQRFLLGIRSAAV
jgi:hypothetical protein